MVLEVGKLQLLLLLRPRAALLGYPPNLEPKSCVADVVADVAVAVAVGLTSWPCASTRLVHITPLSVSKEL